MYGRLGLIMALATPLPVFASEVETSAGMLRISPLVTGLTEPWGLAILPGGAVLITERDGRLLRAEGGAFADVSGVPAVYAEGQGGLLDVMVPRDFATSREVWLTYSVPVGTGSATAVGKGVLSADGTRIDGFTQVFAGDEMPDARHFGSRLVEAGDGTVFVTTGDRGTGPDGTHAQDPSRLEGKVIHLNRDGSPATRLPGARPGVFSTGHRNSQGATLGPDGALWLVEHGARGGDEVNRVEAGRNYGWPVISYGVNYNGDALGVGQAQDGMEQPMHYWDPSIAPSGLLFYDGGRMSDWQGDLFTGSLNSDFIGRLDVDNGFAEERIAAPETGRVRDVVQGPDGSIWFLSMTDGALYRMGPED